MLREVPNLFRQNQGETFTGDWFAIDTQTAKPVLGLPGLQWKNNTWNVHRSMLPLLNDPLAMKALQTDLGPFEPMGRQVRDKFAIERGFKLRETQHSAIQYLTSRRGTLLGDEMRLGKTVSAIMSHMVSTPKDKLVIVAPLMARGVWLGWLRRIFPEREIGLLSGRSFDPSKLNYPIIFAHYDIISSWQTPIPIRTLVFDEAHYLTNSKTKRTLAACYLASYADRVIAMTGTPIWDMPKDLWSVLGLVAPGAFGSYWDFGMRYGKPVASAYGTQFTGISNEGELRERLREVMLRRRWKDVHNDLPPITRSVLIADVNVSTRKRLDVLAAKIKADRTSTIGYLASYRSQLASIKLGTVITRATEIRERNEPVVIWTWHRDFAEQIAERLAGSYLIHGEISATKRDDIIGEWKTKPNSALVATMAVGQVAIDLSHAPENIFAEIDYTPAMIGQAEMRSFSPTRPLRITFVVADHLIDQRIVRALVEKLSAADPLGLAAATDSIDALREHVLGIPDEPDMARFFDDVIANLEIEE